MSQKEQLFSLVRGRKKRQESGFHGAADNGELLGWLDRELDHLFKEFLESPGRAKPCKLTQKASVRSGFKLVPIESHATGDLSAK